MGETGETTPGIDTLKQLSALFDVSINTLLGSPRQLICQCCGMPLDDAVMSREPDGSRNEDFCQLIDFLTGSMANESWPPEQVRAYLEEDLPKLGYWQKIKK